MITILKYPTDSADTLTIIKELLDLGYRTKYSNACNIIIKINEIGEAYSGELTFHNLDPEILHFADSLIIELCDRGCWNYFKTDKEIEIILSKEIAQLIYDNRDMFTI